MPKKARKDKILDRVEELILQKSSTDFTMHELANFVGISPTTFYNLFGSKGAVLYSLLNRGLDKIIDGRGELQDSDDPVAYAIESMTFAGQVFVQHPNLYKPLYKFQLGERDMGARPVYLDRGLKYWHRSLQGLVDCGYLQIEPVADGFSRNDVALALLTHSSGVIDLWVQEDIDDRQFVARMTHDAALIVKAVVPENAQSRVWEIIREVKSQIGKFSFVDR